MKNIQLRRMRLFVLIFIIAFEWRCSIAADVAPPTENIPPAQESENSNPFSKLTDEVDFPSKPFVTNLLRQAWATINALENFPRPLKMKEIKFRVLLKIEDDTVRNTHEIDVEARHAAAEQELKTQVIQFNDAGEILSGGEVLKNIKEDHGIRLMIPGWTDKLDSLQKIKVDDGAWHAWPAVITGDWRHSENVTVVFVEYEKHALRNYWVLAARKYRMVVANAIKIFFEHLLNQLFPDPNSRWKKGEWGRSSSRIIGFFHPEQQYWGDTSEKAREAPQEPREDGVEGEVIEEPHITSRKNYIREKVQIAAHSLGAAVAGTAAEYIESAFEEKVGVIYSLDSPANSFELDYKEHADGYRHLQPRHAHLVLALCSSPIGTKYKLGHLNFYVVGGEVQPNSSMMFENSTGHQRSLLFFRAAFRKPPTNFDINEREHIDNFVIGFEYESHDEALKEYKVVTRTKPAFLSKVVLRRGTTVADYAAIYPNRNKRAIFTVHDHNIHYRHVETHGIYYVPSGDIYPFESIEDKYNAALPLVCRIEKEADESRYIFGEDLVKIVEISPDISED